MQEIICIIRLITDSWKKTKKFQGTEFFKSFSQNPEEKVQKLGVFSHLHLTMDITSPYKPFQFITATKSLLLSYYIWLWTYSLMIEKLILNTPICKTTKLANHCPYYVSALCSPKWFFPFLLFLQHCCCFERKNSIHFLFPTIQKYLMGRKHRKFRIWEWKVLIGWFTTESVLQPLPNTKTMKQWL